ncbi:hypothetical protein [Pyrodictium abyssi]|uniref:Transposase n=1 Tax=Pyrodictium abyssi TaxID=54256 RepID=A0ABM8IX91_9CREN|nr:hypothetical protein PABY_17270 [Pyrodictium abyssi]
MQNLCKQQALDELFQGSLAKYFLRVVEAIWERGQAEAEAIAAMLEKTVWRPVLGFSNSALATREWPSRLLG